MAIEAPVSKFRKNNMKIYLIGWIVISIWFAYDGYYNKEFIEKHTKDGIKDHTLIIHEKFHYLAIPVALLMAGYFVMIKDKKIIAADNELTMDNNLKIPYTAIETIDKTYFDSKGYFVVFYKDQAGAAKKAKISSRQFDNVKPILDLLIGKIS